MRVLGSGSVMRFMIVIGMELEDVKWCSSLYSFYSYSSCDECNMYKLGSGLIPLLCFGATVLFKMGSCDDSVDWMVKVWIDDYVLVSEDLLLHGYLCMYDKSFALVLAVSWLSCPHMVMFGSALVDSFACLHVLRVCGWFSFSFHSCYDYAKGLS
ncbi:hypothetical protein CTI12_AA493500 [Artemisia annua]|uniref:Uncharacterized protein n=1 Tax=Artemisia annua TaxID=35608 RepID=A0A2U1LGL7_ARTAN|nr:hypothetical protein CTI12_AA493500 [Artemisia annua]